MLWADVEDIYAAILAHPFLTGLADGTLPRASFRHYIVQDAHYLRGYARALALCAAQGARRAGDTVMFAEHAARGDRRRAGPARRADGRAGQHRRARRGRSRWPRPRGPTSATCSPPAYGGSFAEAVGAVLPCYWIYARVGDELLARSSPDPLYARWIAMYGGEEFQAVVDSVLELTDRVGAAASRRRAGADARALQPRPSRYEWMFWDAGYRRETWPV